jgi:hypothetical protein
VSSILPSASAVSTPRSANALRGVSFFSRQKMQVSAGCDFSHFG